jgi:hypothetical protein
VGVQETRQFFLIRIEKQLADEGRPLDGFELQYWKALATKGESEVQILWKDKALRGSLDAAEKKFQNALYDAIKHDLMVNSEARTQYLKALDEIKSVDGIQLQALVFAAATEFSELTPNASWLRWVVTAAILTVLGVGLWIGIHLRK